MSNEKIVIIDDDPDVVELMKFSLMRAKYSVVSANNGTEGLNLVNQEHPDLVILDVNMPGLSGFDVLEILRKQSSTALLPVIMLTALSQVQDKVRGIETGADDYLTKPFDPFELQARVTGLISRSKKQMTASPLTHLPGSIYAEEEMKKILASGKQFAVAYLDLDNFKAYNDIYGFGKGDEIIIKTAEIIKEKLKTHGNPEDLVCHIGGDDFIYITTPDRVEDMTKAIIESFDGVVSGFYSAEDRGAGCITAKDRRGNTVTFPLMSVSIGIVTNEKRAFTHFAHVAEIASEVKKVAKGLTGSNYFKDRRIS